MTDEATKLTTRQERFANILFMEPDIYLHDAYLQAGFHPTSVESAKASASKLLTKANFKSHLAKLRKIAQTKAEVSVVKTVKEYSKLAFSNIKDYMNIEDDEVYFKNFDEIPEEQLAAVESVKVMRKVIKGKGDDDDVELQQIQFKLHSKTTALDAIMKHLGGFEKDNTQKADKALVFINYADIDINA